MNVIFLDVDGVLNSSEYFNIADKSNGNYDLADYYLNNLAQIYNLCNAKIVLTSTWRKYPPEHEISKYLVESLAKYGMVIYSKTEVIDNDRPLEIKSWLDSQLHKEDINFVILEDEYEDGYEKYNLNNCFVKTSFYGDSIETSGLTVEAVKQAIEILNNI